MMAQLFRPCIIVTLYALLLPVFGPLLDHHFVEWQHNHAHVYFNGALGESRPGHEHVYETSRSHDHILWSGTLDEKSRPDGVAYLTSYDGAGTGLIYAPSGPATESLCFPIPGGLSGIVRVRFPGHTTPKRLYRPAPQTASSIAPVTHQPGPPAFPVFPL